MAVAEIKKKVGRRREKVKNRVGTSLKEREQRRERKKEKTERARRSFRVGEIEKQQGTRRNCFESILPCRTGVYKNSKRF